MLSDLRYGVRMLAKNPGFSAVAILVLALGIGANSAIFSLINAMLLKPLPIERPGELVGIYNEKTTPPGGFGLSRTPTTATSAPAPMASAVWRRTT